MFSPSISFNPYARVGLQKQPSNPIQSNPIQSNLRSGISVTPKAEATIRAVMTAAEQSTFPNPSASIVANNVDLAISLLKGVPSGIQAKISEYTKIESGLKTPNFNGDDYSLTLQIQNSVENINHQLSNDFTGKIDPNRFPDEDLTNWYCWLVKQRAARTTLIRDFDETPKVTPTPAWIIATELLQLVFQTGNS